jgi:hypothetical protein
MRPVSGVGRLSMRRMVVRRRSMFSVTRVAGRRCCGVSGMRISDDVRAVVVHRFGCDHCVVTAVGSKIIRCFGWPFDCCRTALCDVAVMAVVSCFHLVLHPVLSCPHRDWRRCHPMGQMLHARPLAVATVARLADDPTCHRFV